VFFGFFVAARDEHFIKRHRALQVTVLNEMSAAICAAAVSNPFTKAHPAL